MSIAFKSSESDLPVIPLQRAAECPLHPPAEFASWRDEPGLRRVMYHGQPAWVVSRYEDIRAALLAPRLSADTIPALLKPESPDGTVPVMFARVDDPEHNRLRRMLFRDFTFRRCESMRPQIQELVDGFLDQMIATGPPSDLVHDFALPVPSLVIALLLGVPSEDLELFQRNSTLGLQVGTSDEVREQAFAEMYAYIQDLVERRAHGRSDDMISRLVTDYVATGQLTRETAAMNGVVMMLAGHETSANMISLGTVALLEYPDVYQRLGSTDDQALIANIVEELMRYLSIVHSQVDAGGDRGLRSGRSVDPRRRHGLDEHTRRKLGRGLRRQPAEIRRRTQHPRTSGFRVRRAPVHRAKPGPRGDADRVCHFGATAAGT